jgi:hypothetical protein
MLNVGRADSLGTQIDNVRAKIAQAKGQDKNRPFSMPWDTSLADLEKQLSQYKKIVAELTLENTVLKDVIEKKL